MANSFAITNIVNNVSVSWLGGGLLSASGGVLTLTNATSIVTSPTMTEIGTVNLPAASLDGVTGFSVAINGRYAYVLSNSAIAKLFVVDIFVPTAPVVVGTLTLNGGEGPGTCIAISGTYAFLGLHTGKIVSADISDPALPTRLGSFTPSGATAIHGITVRGSYLYTTDETTPTTINVTDISTPATMVSAAVLTFNAGENQGVQNTVEGRYLYAANYVAPGNLSIADVSNPLAPVRTGSVTFSAGEDNAFGVAVSGRYAFVTLDTSPTRLIVLDVSDPTTPVRVGALTLNSGENQGRYVAVTGNYVYIATWTSPSRIVIVDVSAPTAPVRVGAVTLNSGENFSYGMAISGNYAYVGAANALGIVDLQGIRTNTFSSYSAAISRLNVTDEATIRNRLITHALNVGTGGAFINGYTAIQGTLLVTSSIVIGATAASASSTYGAVTVGGVGLSITPDTSAKLQIGRYSGGSPFSYIKPDSTSSGLKITNAADNADLCIFNNAGLVTVVGTFSTFNVSASATYGNTTIGGVGLSIAPDGSAKLQIGRYSSGDPYSYIKPDSTSLGIRISNAADTVNNFLFLSGSSSTAQFSVLSSLASTSTSTGSIITTGGLGVAGAIFAASFNGNTLTAGTYTLTGTAAKVLTFTNTLTLSGTDASTLNIGTGGTLGAAAFVGLPLAITNGGTAAITAPLALVSLGISRSYNAPTAISGAGDTSLALQTGEMDRLFAVTVQAGSGAYSATLSLASTNAVAGSIIRAIIAMPASLNPTLTIKNLTSAGATLGNPIYGRSMAKTWDLTAQFDGTNWNVINLTQTVFTPITVDFDYFTSTAQDATGGSGANWNWTIPAGANFIKIMAAAPGNGGGSGRKSTALTAGGGGGGASGLVGEATIPVTALSGVGFGINGGTNLVLIIPSGGSGGLSVTTDVTNGNPGVAATPSLSITASGVRVISVDVNVAAAAGGGLVAAGGAGGAAGGGNGQYISLAGGLGGFAVGAAVGASPTVSAANGYGAGGGGGGGGINTSGKGGGAGGMSTEYFTTAPAAGASGGFTGANASGVVGAMNGWGIGGAGGGSNISGAGGMGGKGWRGGGGGGGGGASGNSGPGGDGGDGWVRIIVY